MPYQVDVCWGCQTEARQALAAFAAGVIEAFGFEDLAHEHGWFQVPEGVTGEHVDLARENARMRGALKGLSQCDASEAARYGSMGAHIVAQAVREVAKKALGENT